MTESTETEPEINRPEVLAEVRDAFARYEQALEHNDVAALGDFFWSSPLTIRYGPNGDNGYGWEAIQGHRRARRDSGGPWRVLERTVITTFGTDMATASTLYRDPGRPELLGRQMQTWWRIGGAWKIVAAHVSFAPERV